MMSSSNFPTTMTNTTNTVTTATSATSSSAPYQYKFSKNTSGNDFISPSTIPSGGRNQSLRSQINLGVTTGGGGGGSTSGYNSSVNNANDTATATTTTVSDNTTGAQSTSFYNHHYQQPSGHSFLSDVNEVKDMENSLLALLASFHAGDLSAFGKGCSLQTMETIRAKQERLAKLHFELGSTKAGTGTTDSTTQNWMSDDDQNKLVAELRELSLEIEKLHETSS